MKRELAPIRPAMTAIAAAMVLSSTSLPAQMTDASAGQSVPAAPVVEVPAAPAIAAAAPADPSPPSVTATPPAAAPAPAMRTMSTPVEHTGEDAAEAPAAASRTAANLTSGAGVARSAVHPAAPKSAAAPHSTASVTTTKTAAASEVAEPQPVAPAPQPTLKNDAPTPASAQTQTVQTSRQSDDATLPVAGGIALGLLAVGGAAFALGRRRERDEDELVLGSADLERAAEPATVRPAFAEPAPVLRSAPAAVGASTVPTGFDLSRFGRHTQAAYSGPTSDNPFLSLRRRLKRASFLDQREREAGMASQTAPVAQVATQAAAREQGDAGQITVRLNPRRQTNGFGYAFQR